MSEKKMEVTALEFLEEVWTCEDLPLRDRTKARGSAIRPSEAQLDGSCPHGGLRGGAP